MNKEEGLGKGIFDAGNVDSMITESGAVSRNGTGAEENAGLFAFGDKIGQLAALDFVRWSFVMTQGLMRLASSEGRNRHQGTGNGISHLNFPRVYFQRGVRLAIRFEFEVQNMERAFGKFELATGTVQ